MAKSREQDRHGAMEDERRSSICRDVSVEERQTVTVTVRKAAVALQRFNSP